MISKYIVPNLNFPLILIMISFQIQSAVTVPDQCKSYNVLNNPKRKMSYVLPDRNKGYHCDKASMKHLSPDWKGTGWYRVQEPAGSRIPDTPTEENHCGSHISGWIQGNHPSLVGEEKNAKVCFSYQNKDCRWSGSVKILHCDSYFLYYLTETPVCHASYCTI